MDLRYGGVVVSGGGHVLLREPAGHFGGYVWTFPKGSPDPGESPAGAALREVREETGYAARILEPIPGRFGGSTSSTSFFLMDAAHPPGGFDRRETSAVRWVRFAEARELIGETRIIVGRERDLQVLDAAARVLERLPAGRRPAVQPEDCHGLHELPPRSVTLALDRQFAADAMDAIRRGLLPKTSSDEWFAWFSGNRLRIHRSWTGWLIFEAVFEHAAGDGATLREAIVNVDPAQYSYVDADAATAQLVALLQRMAAARG